MKRALADTQLLVFEITDKCNLSKEHEKLCPVALPDRYGNLDVSRALTDDMIAACVRTAYRELGFKGLVAWHYYCEPMLEWPRLQKLMARLRAELPESGFLLFTNGTLLPEDLSGLSVFSRIYITNYGGREFSALRRALPGVAVNIEKPALDGRAGCGKNRSAARCLRPAVELIIDHYGNGHICCMDFRGEARMGNVWNEGFRRVAGNFAELQRRLMREPLPANTPEFCLDCRGRRADVVRIVPELADEIETRVLLRHGPVLRAAKKIIRSRIGRVPFLRGCLDRLRGL